VGPTCSGKIPDPSQDYRTGLISGLSEITVEGIYKMCEEIKSIMREIKSYDEVGLSTRYLLWAVK